ncbi:MAG: glycine cleavage system aminomethyltransferase GcvT [Demequinaceae bacterium]|nr:glycine cleavage system aminomethyltransferase GcvT [Demequinaceae bacterium]
MTRHSPLEDRHSALGASLIEFAGWLMPVRYSSDLAEHVAVRTGAGLFDLSHMGEIVVTGPGAADALDFALVGRAGIIEAGRAKYTMICAEDGGVIDDLVAYRLGADRFMIVANASNADVVVGEIRQRCQGFECEVLDESARTALVAVQGPLALKIVEAMVDPGDVSLVSSLRYYASATASVDGKSLLIARTGYTGEDGFEFFCPIDRAGHLWDLALEKGAPMGIAVCGLAARDTLRLEAGMPLYGHELSLERTPFEAGLGRVVRLGSPEKPRAEFVGQAALGEAAARRSAWNEDPESAPEDARVLIGLEGEGRRSAREGYAVFATEGAVGQVTSGAPSPTLGHPIAMAYVHPKYSAVGTHLKVDIRGRHEEMVVSALPFYQRPNY